MATQVTLYVGLNGRLDPTTRIIDATSFLAPNGGTYVFNGLTRGVVYNVWLKLTYPTGKDLVFYLGKTTRAVLLDTIPPTVGNASLTRSITNPETALVLQVTVTDAT
jgi:hypothetical protein